MLASAFSGGRSTNGGIRLQGPSLLGIGSAESGYTELVYKGMENTKAGNTRMRVIIDDYSG